MPRALVVYQGGKNLEFTIIIGAGGFLERGDGQRIVLMLLSILAPLIYAARRKCYFRGNPLRIGARVTLQQFSGDSVDIGASDTRRRPCEIAVYNGMMQANRFPSWPWF